jgi:hypothetical protein
MFDRLGTFDEAFAESHVEPMIPRSKPLKQRKTIKQIFVFWLANALAIPVIGLIAASLVAQGLRLLLPIFQTRLYKLPILAATRDYVGFDKIDLAVVMSVLLFALVSCLWCRIFTELAGQGTIAEQRSKNPIIFYLLTGIASIIVGVDALIFFIGLRAAESGWGETPFFVAPIATLLWSSILAILGWYHSDYQHSNIV